MKTKTKIKRMFHWISRRSEFLIAIFLFAIVVILILFFSAGFSPENEKIMIGLAASSAFLAAVSAISSLMQALETQRQRENLERPYVTAYFDCTSGGAIYFVIENSGNSPALDITFRFNPPPIDHKGRPLNEISLFANPISFLPNGKVVRQIIDASYRFFEDGKPLKYEITTEYYSAFGNSFGDTIEHNLEYLKNVTLPRKTSDDYLQDISKELSELTRLINKAQGLNSFLVESPDEYSSRMEILRNKHNKHTGIMKLLQYLFAWIHSKLTNGK